MKISNLNLLIPTPQPEPTETKRWATVTTASPLRIRRDTEPTALPVPVIDLVGGLKVGDRVWTTLHTDGQVYVTDRLGGADTINQINRGVVLISASNAYQTTTFPVTGWPASPYFAWGAQGWWHTGTAPAGDVVYLDEPGYYRLTGRVIFSRTGDASTFAVGPWVAKVETTGWLRMQVIGLSQPNNRMIAGFVGSGVSGLPANQEHIAHAGVTTNSVIACMTIEKLT